MRVLSLLPTLINGMKNVGLNGMYSERRSKCLIFSNFEHLKNLVLFKYVFVFGY